MIVHKVVHMSPLKIKWVPTSQVWNVELHNLDSTQSTTFTINFSKDISTIHNNHKYTQNDRAQNTKQWNPNQFKLQKPKNHNTNHSSQKFNTFFSNTNFQMKTNIQWPSFSPRIISIIKEENNTHNNKTHVLKP